MDFTADHRVLLSAFGDSAIWAVALIGASAPLRLVDGAYSRSDGKKFVIVRDSEHHLPGRFVARLFARPMRGPLPLAGTNVLAGRSARALKAPRGPLLCPPRRDEHERLAAFAAYQSVLWMLADERVHGTENGDMLCVGLRRPRIGFALDV